MNKIMCMSSIFMFFSFPAYGMEKSLKAHHDGLTCAECHGVENPKPPFIKTNCSACHDAVELAEITKDSLPVNPHTSPHWGTNAACSACHKEHRQNIYMCNDCHTYDTTPITDFLK